MQILVLGGLEVGDMEECQEVHETNYTVNKNEKKKLAALRDEFERFFKRLMVTSH